MEEDPWAVVSTPSDPRIHFYRFKSIQVLTCLYKNDVNLHIVEGGHEIFPESGVKIFKFLDESGYLGVNSGAGGESPARPQTA